MRSILEELDEYRQRLHAINRALAEAAEQDRQTVAALRNTEAALAAYHERVGAGQPADPAEETRLVAELGRLRERIGQDRDGRWFDRQAAGRRAQLVAERGRADADLASFARARQHELIAALLPAARDHRERVREAIGQLAAAARAWQAFVDANADVWRALGVGSRDLPANPLDGLVERARSVLAAVEREPHLALPLPTRLLPAGELPGTPWVRFPGRTVRMGR